MDKTEASSPVAEVATDTAALASEAAPISVADIAVLPADHWTQAPDGSDDDSGLDDAKSSTASITSSILKYRTINGRRYHSERGNAQYWGANDNQQSASMDMLHHAFTLCLDGKLYLAPLENPKNVLDIGTGTGLWAIDFADAHPECSVIGTDVSPIQPLWVPPNLRFEIEDFTNPWSFAPGRFGYVHLRYLVGSVGNWYSLFREAYTALEPGGYMESFEASPLALSDDDTLPPDSAIAQWGPIFFQGGEKIGHTFRVLEDNLQVKAMEAAGFVDIKTKDIKCPIGTWPRDPRQREIGEISMWGLVNDVEGFIMFFTSILGWTRDQVTVYAAHARRETKSGKVHMYYKQRVVYGRKPITVEA